MSYLRHPAAPVDAMPGVCFRSSSESSTSNQTHQTDERVAATDNAVVVQLEDTAQVQIESLDGEVIGNVLDGLGTLVEFAGGQIDAERALTSRSLDIVSKNAQTEDNNIAERLIIAGAIVAVAVTVGPKLLR